MGKVQARKFDEGTHRQANIAISGISSMQAQPGSPGLDNTHIAAQPRPQQLPHLARLGSPPPRVCPPLPQLRRTALHALRRLCPHRVPPLGPAIQEETTGRAQGAMHTCMITPAASATPALLFSSA